MAETTETLEDYEELFANRFTSEDHEYQEYLKRAPDPPPIVENWRGRGGGHRGGRDNRYQDRRGGWGGRGYGGERGWRGDERGHYQDRDRGYGRDRERDRSPNRDRGRSWDSNRDRGYRGGYQSYSQGSGQGYNSQRPQYDRY